MNMDFKSEIKYYYFLSNDRLFIEANQSVIECTVAKIVPNFMLK